jgi:hypothetical protein
MSESFQGNTFQADAFQSVDVIAPAFDNAFQTNAFQSSAAGVTADSSLTADSGCWTADGRIICIPADVAESASAFDAIDAVAIAGGAVIAADVAEAASAFDQANAVSSVSANAIEPASALDVLDAALNAQILFGTVDESIGSVAFDDNAFQTDAFQAVGAALDQLDATVEAATVPIDGGGAYYPPLQRPYPVVGRGYGVLPQLWGEAHGVVGAVGKSSAQIVVRAAAIGACGQAGNATVTLSLSVVGKGAVGARGVGNGMILKVSGSATGYHDDDEAAAVIAILLAA